MFFIINFFGSVGPLFLKIKSEQQEINFYGLTIIHHCNLPPSGLLKVWKLRAGAGVDTQFSAQLLLKYTPCPPAPPFFHVSTCIVAICSVVQWASYSGAKNVERSQPHQRDLRFQKVLDALHVYRVEPEPADSGWSPSIRWSLRKVPNELAFTCVQYLTALMVTLY